MPLIRKRRLRLRQIPGRDRADVAGQWQNACVPNLKPPFPAYRGSDGYAFVSYAHADAELVYPIITRLHDEGFRIWYDEGIEPGEEWAKRLDSAIQGCSAFVLFVSAVSVARPGVTNEVHVAHTTNRQFLPILLEEADLPPGIRLAGGPIQGVTAFRQPRDKTYAEVRAALAKFGVVVDEHSRTVQVSEPAVTDHGQGLLAGRPRRRARNLTAGEAFVDRVPESVALRKSYERQYQRLIGVEPLQSDVFPNVLVFFGGGGLGKTGLSKRLERWMSGGLSDAKEWGVWPHQTVTSVRWDFHTSTGNVDLVQLLLTLRASLVPWGRSWGAFDIALGRYLEAVRPGQQDNLGLTGNAEDQVLRTFKGVAAELGLSPIATLTPASVRYVCNELQMAHHREHRLWSREGLTDVLTGAESITQGSQNPDVVVDLLYVLSEEIAAIAPAERPVLVFFLDPFERVQNQLGESVLADLIAALPLALFVVTGRNKLRWAEPGYTRLTVAGPAAWPGLVEGAIDDPRQHILGRLSDDDTRLFYRSRRDRSRWNMSDHVIEGLVQRSGGLPLHIEAVLKLTENLQKANPGIEFTGEALSGELPDVVTNLVDTLTREEADAFRAACVLPAFDVALAAAVGKVHGQEVERAINDALIEKDESSVYPYRVHDEIRRLIRLDRTSRGAWSEQEWKDAARRGMDEAIARVEAGHAQSSDETQLAGLALAINLGFEWDQYPSGLAKLIHDGPSIVGLAPLIPPLSEAKTGSAIGDLIQFVHAMTVSYIDAGDVLKAINSPHPEVDRYARLWSAYRLRAVARFDEALAELRELVQRYPDKARTAQNQIGVTLRTSRRFVDALDHIRSVRPDRIEDYERSINRLHGIPDLDAAGTARKLSETTSRRYQSELEVTDLVRRSRFEGGVDPREVDIAMERALDRGQRSDYRNCLLLKGYDALADNQRYADALARLEEHMASYGSTAPSGVHLRCLRALLTGDPEDARAGYETLVARLRPRGTAWIPAEVWLEELGYEIPPVDSQWLIPYDQVRANWLVVADRIIERAKGNVG